MNRASKEESDQRSAKPGAASRAARNTLTRAVGEVFGKLASFIVFAVLSRFGGEGELGRYFYAFAWVQVSVLAIDLGLDRWLLRHISRDPDVRKRSFFDVIGVKAVSSVPVVAISLTLAFTVVKDPSIRFAIVVFTPGLMLDSLRRSIGAVIDSHEASHLVAVHTAITRVITAAMGIAVLYAGGLVVALAVTYTMGSAVGLSIALYQLTRKIGLPKLAFERSTWPGLTRNSIPFATQDLLDFLLARVATLILYPFAGADAVGQYGAAYRLLEATYFVNIALYGAFGAMFTYLGKDTRPRIADAYNFAIKLCVAALLPLAIICLARAEYVMTTIFGQDLANAAGTLRLLAFVIPLAGLAYLSTTLLLARGSPKTMLRWGIAAGVGNVVLSIVLIPPYGAEGASAALLLTEIAFAFVLLITVGRRIGRLSLRSMFGAPLFGAIALAGALAVWPLAGMLSIVAGLAVYAVVTSTLEYVLNRTDFEALLAVLRRGMARTAEARSS